MTPFTYTNRKGFTYFLNCGVTKTGKPRYYFAREAALKKHPKSKKIPRSGQI